VCTSGNFVPRSVQAIGSTSRTNPRTTPRFDPHPDGTVPLTAQ
jgi:hypothetical protein